MLQQKMTLFPFMKQPITLAAIACRASKNNIADIIAAAFNQRYHMIGMKRPFTKTNWSLAIVAFTMLSFELLLNLRRSVGTWSLSSACAPIMHMNAPYHITVACQSIAFLAFTSNLFAVFSLSMSPFPLSIMLYPGISIPFMSFSALLFMGLLVVTVLFSKPITIFDVILLVICLTLWTMPIRILALIATYFTCLIQFIGSALTSSEILRGSRFPGLFAIGIGAFLQRNIRGIIHSLNHLSFSTLFLLVARMQGYIFSAWEATPSLGNMSIIPFFPRLQKAVNP